MIKTNLKKLLWWVGYELKRIPPSEKIKSSGDLRKIFSHVYKKNLWGGEKGQLYSGPGSDESVSQEYIKVINDFIKQKSIKQVIDIGCGDFRVGRLIDKSSLKYIGADIVPDLIKRNTKLFGSDKITFKCLNAVDDQLPDGDLCLIRQVLQHLSNQHIEIILEKCKKYKYIIVSEHIPTGKDVISNLDMNADWGIRASQNSGVFIDMAPFSYKAETLLEVDPSHEGYSGSLIRTSLIQNF